MSRPCSDVKRRCLNVALIRKRPLVVLGGQLAHWILIFCSCDDGLEGVGTILRLGRASNARNPSHGQLKPWMGCDTLLVPTSTLFILSDESAGRKLAWWATVSKEPRAGFTVQICNAVGMKTFGQHHKPSSKPCRYERSFFYLMSPGIPLVFPRRNRRPRSRQHGPSPLQHPFPRPNIPAEQPGRTR